MRKYLLSFLFTTLALSGVARAQVGYQVGYPDEYALRPLRLPTGMVQVKVPLGINLSRGSSASPIFMPFELRLGLTHELEMRIFQPGVGLCLKGCDRAYNDLALGLLYSLVRDANSELALLGAFKVTSFSEPTMRLDLGVAYKFVQAPFSIAASPVVGIGIDHRDSNGDSLEVPVQFAFQLAPPTALFFDSGMFGGLRDFGNTWHIPFGAGINYLLQRGMDLGAEFIFPELIGNGAGADARLLYVYVAWTP